MLARCAAPELEQADPLAEGVEDLLRAAGFEVQRLDLPPIEQANPLKWLASLRLMPVDRMADALVCLDARSAILNHSRKCVWLLEDEALVEPIDTDDPFLANVIGAGLREARRMFSASARLAELKKSGWPKARPLDFDAPKSPTNRKSRSSRQYAPLFQALRG